MLQFLNYSFHRFRNMNKKTFTTQYNSKPNMWKEISTINIIRALLNEKMTKYRNDLLIYFAFNTNIEDYFANDTLRFTQDIKSCS